MREYGSAFCRVCEHLLANSINEVARPADLAGPFPPGW
jgi:hypothetical protein